MKNTTLLIALITFVISTTAQNTPSYIPTDSLVGYWGFNGNTDDESGNGNNGLANGVSLTKDRHGNLNSAYSFDGIDDYIEILDNGRLNTEYVTVSIWFLTNTNKSSSLIYKTDDNALNEQYTCILNYPNTNTTQWSVKNGNNCNSPGSGWKYTFMPYTSDSIWHNFTLTYDGTKSKIYIDSELIIDTVYSMGTIDLCGSKINIGKGYNSTYPFLGSIDEIGIWSRALSESEIKAIYNENVCTDTIQVMVYDTTFVTVNDTITHNDTNFVIISDTVIYYDSVSVAVTDTLIINAEISGLNSHNNINTLKVYPNPTNDVVIIDNGDFSLMSAYKLKIVNSLGAEVFNSFVSIPQFQIPVSSIGGNGLYYIQIFDENSSLLTTKKLILK